MIYIYLLSIVALFPIIAYLLSQKTINKGYIFGFSINVILFCILIFVGKFSFLGSLKEQEINIQIKSSISKDEAIPSNTIAEFEKHIEDSLKSEWMHAYINQAILSKKLNTAEYLISYSEKYFKSPDEKFIFYSLYTKLRDSKFPAFAASNFLLKLEPISDCREFSGQIELFIMNGPNLPIAKKNFENVSQVSLSNIDSSIPGFDLTSVYLNRETTELKVALRCLNSSRNLKYETSILFDQNSSSNTYKIGSNQWLKKEQ
jgi:hypothetical protein